MKQPEGFIKMGEEHFVRKLEKSIYGLKQSPRCWNSVGPVSWRSKKQTCVALSTTEAEYMALASAGQEAVWMRLLTSELCGSSMEEIIVYEDNQSAIQMAKNPQFHGHTKQIEIKYHFIRKLVSNGVVQLKYCPAEEMMADMLTKGLSHDQFVKLQYLAGIKVMLSCK